MTGPIVFINTAIEKPPWYQIQSASIASLPLRGCTVKTVNIKGPVRPILFSNVIPSWPSICWIGCWAREMCRKQFRCHPNQNVCQVLPRHSATSVRWRDWPWHTDRPRQFVMIFKKSIYRVALAFEFITSPTSIRLNIRYQQRPELRRPIFSPSIMEKTHWDCRQATSKFGSEQVAHTKGTTKLEDLLGYLHFDVISWVVDNFVGPNLLDISYIKRFRAGIFLLERCIVPVHLTPVDILSSFPLYNVTNVSVPTFAKNIYNNVDR